MTHIPLLLAASIIAVLPDQARASVAEHEPAAGALWLGVIAVAGMSMVMAYRRWWLPLVFWVPVALIDSGLIAHFLDPQIGPAVRDELGMFYLLQAELCEALAIVFPLAIAHSRLSRKPDESVFRRGR